MKNQLFFLFVLFSLSSTYAQRLRPIDVLRGAVSDERVQRHQQLTSYARGLRYKAPLLRKVEGRFGFNGSTVGDTLFGTIRNEDFYGIVLSPNNLRERRRQTALQNAQVGVYESERAVILQEIVLERGETLIGLYFSARRQAACDSLIGLMKRKEALLHEMLDQGFDVRVKDVLNVDEDKNELEMMRRQWTDSYAQYELQLQQFLPDYPTPQLDDSDYIRPSTLGKRLLEISAWPAAYPELAYLNAETQFAAADLALENADNRQIFSFLQVGYEDPVLALETPKNRKTFNNFSMRFGLQLPLPGNNNLDRSERALKLRETQNAVQSVRWINTRESAVQQVKLFNLLRQYDAAAEQQRSSLTNRMISNTALHAQLSAVELLDLYISQQKTQLQLLELEAQMNAEYLEFLELKGLLGQEPLRDYFSETGF